MRDGPLRRLVPLLLALVFAAGAAGQTARPWYEEYEIGLQALRAGRAGDAIAAFELAARLRPEPGRNVQTYGTNFLTDYQPYLKLAEACLLVEDTRAARLALERGQRYAEPAAERARLLGRIEAIEARAAAAAQAARATPVPTPEPTRPPATPAPTPQPTAQPTPAPPRETPSAVPSPRPAATTKERATTLVLNTSPPGASVYLDDALIGTTDPLTGRLRLPSVAPGRHRLRVAAPGRSDQLGELELAVGDTHELEIALTPRAAAPTPTAASGLEPGRAVAERRLGTWQVLGAIAMVGALLWLALRRRRSDGTGSLTWTFAFPTPGARPPSGRTPAAGVERTPGGSLRTPRPFEVEEAFPAPFGDYTLHARLGRGGMAIVYEAERGGERVALKRPLPGFQEDPRFLERFLREAEIGRTLHHPNVIRILDRGEIDGIPFFTMERVEGETLAQRLRREGALPDHEVRRILLAVAEALDYGHSKGVVHRDLKPSNVLLGRDGTVKVTDYGIARARRFEGMTATGAFLGSPDYAAPEMIEGREIDARADLYALGVIAYEMLAGRRPFEADAPFAVLRLHMSEAPRPLRELVPALAPDLETEVMRLLAKDPADRHADAEELLQKLRLVL
ncbi:MAG: protein kinase [Vicinamibacteria bacterium]|nr:protein kinase [Vicinamibacteria bacterium]